jgi:RNA polymerase sigma-70 factor (ECF subfamily)
MSVVPHEAHPGAAVADRQTASLYARHYTEVYAFCRRRLRNHEEAEDATQITFVKAFRALRGGAEPQHDAAWLFTIAKNVVATHAQSAARIRAVEVVDDVEPAAPAPDAEHVRDLLRAVEELPETPRRAFLMREWQGLEYGEIASALGMERNAVGVMLLRARRRVAEKAICLS